MNHGAGVKDAVCVSRQKENKLVKDDALSDQGRLQTSGDIYGSVGAPITRVRPALHSRFNQPVLTFSPRRRSGPLLSLKNYKDSN